MQSLLVRLHLVRGTKRSFVVLDGISGVISPGRLTLLLGPPGSGKSTLLQALAGKFHHNGPLLVRIVPNAVAVHLPAMHCLVTRHSETECYKVRLGCR